MTNSSLKWQDNVLNLKRKTYAKFEFKKTEQVHEHALLLPNKKNGELQIQRSCFREEPIVLCKKACVTRALVQTKSTLKLTKPR